MGANSRFTAERIESWTGDGCVVSADQRAVRAKRVLDLVGAAVLGVILLPLMLVLALAIAVSSPGPILFTQERVGKNGRRFRMYKFRTMVPNSDPSVHRAYAQALIRGEAERIGPVYKLASADRRVTLVGRVLRRTSLDELPQLLNVLRGDMSLVGPRPPVPYEAELYTPREWIRQSVPPGVTGLWQVSGRSTLSFREMIELDLQYVESWSIWLDVKILLRTPRVILNIHEAG